METITAPKLVTGLLSQTRVGRFTASGLHKLFTTPRLTKDLKERIEAGEIIFGDTALSHIAEKAWERLSLSTNNGPMTRATDRGNDLEAVAFELLSRHWMTLAKNYANDGFLEYGTNAGATPDAYAEEGKATVDIKCPWNGEKLLVFASEVKDDDPMSLFEFSADYFWQTQLQMLAAGADHGFLVYFDDRWVNTPCDVSEFLGLPATQFGLKGGFAFAARRIPLVNTSKDRIDRVLIRAEEECQRLVSLFAESM